MAAAAASRNEAEAEGSGIGAGASAAASVSTSTEARSSLTHRLPGKRKVDRAVKSTQSNFLAFAIDSMEDLVMQIPQFLTLEGLDGGMSG